MQREKTGEVALAFLQTSYRVHPLHHNETKCMDVTKEVSLYLPFPKWLDFQ